MIDTYNFRLSKAICCRCSCFRFAYLSCWPALVLSGLLLHMPSSWALHIEHPAHKCLHPPQSVLKSILAASSFHSSSLLPLHYLRLPEILTSSSRPSLLYQSPLSYYTNLFINIAVLYMSIPADKHLYRRLSNRCIASSTRYNAPGV